MIRNEIMHAIDEEYRKINRFPDHICGQVGTITAPAGRLMTLALNQKYDGKEDKEAMKREAVKTAAMCIKFLQEIN